MLSNGKKEDVEETVKECISKAAQNGGFLITSSNSIHSSINPENYLTMLKTAKKYGIYPDLINITKK